MALPVILVNSATGSDTQASGAGPATALFGTTDASTDGAGTTVTLTALTDLTNVATDGSHVIFFNDSTAGKRNFGKITGKAGSGGATPTVTVSDAFALSASGKSWAIGGKRASIGSTTSAKLWENNGGSGDMMPGWIQEMESGHTETIAAQIAPRRSGDTTNGRIIFRGTSGAGTMPVLTFSNNANAIAPVGNFLTFRDFELRNSNATKTASIAITIFGSTYLHVINVKIAHSTNKFWKAINLSSTANALTIRNCEIGYTASDGISVQGGQTPHIFGCRIHDCGGHGIIDTGTTAATIAYNTIYNNAGDGINHAASADPQRLYTIVGNTVHNNTGDGYELNTNNTGNSNILLANNIFSSNGGYALNFTGASISDLVLAAQGVKVFNNNHYTNTSGWSNITTTFDVGTQNLNPTYTDSANGDFTPGNTSLKGTAFPLALVATSYGYPGAIQPNAAAAAAIQSLFTRNIGTY